ncbi:unnamed protein product [Cuscuta campestris]|uniref:At2g35280-like TPR domain-containing protein n=2 Tax=Cuscuta sect. Cleistogrammica TaxID=1824901 RepID=A0A484M0E1_9ASTE|nr:hypothetical protein DM860_012880 [Cuscuta australis]VFQ81844.1 unnamed protein product [Cuscuta campestris]
MAAGKRKSTQRRGRRGTAATGIHKSSIPLLPRDLIVEVLARVACRSLDDFVNAKLSCQEWCQLGDESYVYKHASLAKFQIFPGWKQQSAEKKRKTSLFLYKCINAGNPEALFRTGVVGFFGCTEPIEYALECLKKAGNEGHVGAAYTICMISILFLGGEHREKGIMVLSAMKESKELKERVREAREELVRILRMIWKNKLHVRVQRPVCCSTADHCSRKRGWDFDEEDTSAECAYCRCDFEVFHVHKALPLLPLS